MWNMMCQRFISVFEPKWIVAIAIVTSQMILHTLRIQNKNGCSFKQFCYLCSKGRGGHIPENMKTTSWKHENYSFPANTWFETEFWNDRQKFFCTIFKLSSKKKKPQLMERKNQMHIIKFSKLFITAVRKYSSSQFNSSCMSSS